MKVNVTVVAAAYLVTLVMSESLDGLPEILLFAKLNVFALPLAAGTSLFEFPMWVWYIASLMWILQVMHYAGLTVVDAVRFALNRE